MNGKKYNYLISDEEEKKIIKTWLGNNEGKKSIPLYDLAYSIFSKFGGIYQSDYDDFFSEAGSIFFDCLKNFDPNNGASFKTYLNMCLSNKLKALLSYRNRVMRGGKVEENEDKNKAKRYIAEKPRSLNEPISEECDEELMTVIMDKKTVEDYIPEFQESDNVQMFLNNLSRKNKKVAILIINKCSRRDVCAILKITGFEYDQALKEFRSSENISILLGGK